MSDVHLSIYSGFVREKTKEMGSLKLNILHAALGCGTEAGELMDTAKKMWIYQQSIGTLNKEGVSHHRNLVEELGDLLFYAQMMCNHLEISLDDAIAENMEKLNKRYPKGYSDTAAAERADKAAG